MMPPTAAPGACLPASSQTWGGGRTGSHAGLPAWDTLGGGGRRLQPDRADREPRRLCRYVGVVAGLRGRVGCDLNRGEVRTGVRACVRRAAGSDRRPGPGDLVRMRSREPSIPEVVRSLRVPGGVDCDRRLGGRRIDDGARGCGAAARARNDDRRKARAAVHDELFEACVEPDMFAAFGGAIRRTATVSPQCRHATQAGHRVRVVEPGCAPRSAGQTRTDRVRGALYGLARASFHLGRGRSQPDCDPPARPGSRGTIRARASVATPGSPDLQSR